MISKVLRQHLRALDGSTGRRACVRNLFGLILVSLGLRAACLATDAPPPPAGSNEVIRLGMSTVISGPAADLGLQMRAGVLAALDKANRHGGIHGRSLQLITLDDGYEPTRTAPNMRQLVDRQRVLTVIGNVGTPTAVAAIPIAIESGTPFFGACSGAGILRTKPPQRYLINYRASYEEETAAMVDALIVFGGIRPEEIALFTQRDTYGDAGLSGAVAALKRHGLAEETRLAHVRYERNTIAVEKAVADLIALDPPPKAVIMVGVYAPCAAFIKLARAHHFHPRFLNVSFVGSEPLAAALGDDGDGVIVTQVVPHYKSDLPLVHEFRAALKASDRYSTPTFGSLEGYVSTRILLRALASIPGRPTRVEVVDALERLGRFDLGLNAPLELSPTEHQACHQVWPTILKGGRVVPARWDEIFSP